MPRQISKQKTVVISLHIPESLLRELDELVAEGVFPSRSEAIRYAIRMLLWREQWRLGKDLKPEVA